MEGELFREYEKEEVPGSEEIKETLFLGGGLDLCLEGEWDLKRLKAETNLTLVAEGLHASTL